MYSRLCTLSLTVLVCATFSLYTADPDRNDTWITWDSFNYPGDLSACFSKKKIKLCVTKGELVSLALSTIGESAQKNSCRYNLNIRVIKVNDTGFYFANGSISDDNMKVVGDQLTALKALDISENSFTEGGASVFAAALSKSTTLTTLKMANLKNDAATLVCLLQGLFYNTTLTKL